MSAGADLAVDVDGNLIGRGQPGELTRRLREWYLDEIERATARQEAR